MEENLRALLLKDLCARLPYGLVINTGDKNLVLDRQHQGIGILYPEDCSDEFNERNNNASFYTTISGCYYGEEIKPYFRPMSSMTEKEKKELINIGPYLVNGNNIVIGVQCNSFVQLSKCEEWLNKKMFDYRGLIPMGLALEAPEGMYNIREK